MKPIPGFVGGAYQSQTLPASTQRTLNLYVERNDAGGIPEVLIGTPGLRLIYTMSGGSSRGAIEMKGRKFRVGGSTLYETTGDTPRSIGNLSTSTGSLSMATNGSQILIVDGVKGYIYDGALSVIADPDFPNGVTRAGWEGNIFVVAVDGSQKFEASGLGTAATWDGLDFASAENKPENIVTFIINHDRIIFFTETGAEQWVNTGDAEFTFERDNGSSVEVGCEASDSVVTLNNGTYWLGRDKDGGAMVFSLQGGIPSRISTHAIESEFQSYSVRSDAYGMAYQQGGHTFYLLTFPSAEKTWGFDVATQEWAERTYLNAETNTRSRWRGRDHLYFSGVHEVGDYENGNVYALDPDVGTDNGAVMEWVRSCPPIMAGYGRMTFNRFALDAEMGATDWAGEPVSMRFSNDGGKTFTDPRSKTLGAIGDFGNQVTFYRCGTMKANGKRVFEISGRRQGRIALYNAYIDATVDG